MAGKPIPGPESAADSEDPVQMSPDAAGDAAGDRPYGTLAVHRMCKDDGRALIAYERRIAEDER